MNKRIKCIKGKKLQTGSKYVGRPSLFGNPFKVNSWLKDFDLLKKLGKEQPIHISNNQIAVWLYELYFASELRNKVEQLRNYDLACWCSPDEVCHADYLLKFLEYTK